MLKIVPRTIVGGSCTHNKSAFEWGHHGLIAYGSSTMVAVVDSTSLQHVTALHGHRSPVTKITWAPSNIPIDDEQEHIYLCSADTSGFIILFDVTTGKAKQRISESNKVVNAMEMFYANYAELCLLSLHQPGILILWNAKTGEKIWKKSFNDTFSAFSRDPFTNRNIILNGGSFIQYLTDFSANQVPSDGSKLYLSSPSTNDSTLSPKSDKKTKSFGSLNEMQRRSRVLLGDKARLSSVEDDTLLRNVQYVHYHKTRRNTLILSYAQDILIIDLDIWQTVSVISLERTTCPFLEIYPCWSRDAFYCLHDNGTVVLRVKNSSTFSLSDSNDDYGPMSPKVSELLYESYCSSDGMRITKSQRIHGLTVCPITEVKAAVITSEGKLLIWELVGSTRPSLGGQGVERPVVCLSDLISPSTTGNFVPSNDDKCSFMLTGFTNSLPQSPFVVRMCPPLTTKNIHVYQPHLAVGTMSGIVQVYNLYTGVLVRDLTIHSCQVRGVEWASLSSLITHACESLNGLQGRSELAHVDVHTGKVTNFRQSKPDEGVIQAVRISHLRQYMILVFRNKPMELWELRSLTLLREMPPDFPVITALEWSPNAKKKSADEHQKDNAQSSSHLAKEHFVLTDNTGLLYHFIVEGNTVKDGSKINAEGVNGTVSSLAWKQDLMILGDVNSNLSFWDLKSKKSRNKAMNKGMVRKIRFAPGKDNQKILIIFHDEVQIWDKTTQNISSSLKFPKEIGRVNDGDWVSSDKIVLSIADGYVAVTDTSLKTFMSPLTDAVNSEDSFLPGLLRSNQLAHCYTMCSQPWSDSLHLPDSVHLDDEIRDYLLNPRIGILERAQIMSYLYGESFSVKFWILATYYVNKFKQEKEDGSGDFLDRMLEPLESNFDMFLDCETYKCNELTRLQVQDNKKHGPETRLECARRYILLGKFDRAIHLLLESEADTNSFYSDSLRACLLATMRSSGTSQSTIKLVATSLIAHDRIAEGVELLCLIDKSLDACRYLQTYGQWNEAVWLAKVTLSDEEFASVISRWITEYLCLPSNNMKHQALFAALSIGDFMKVVEMLYSMQCFSLCAIFVEVCMEAEVLEKTNKTSLAPIIESVFLQYAKRLQAANIVDGAKHYCQLAGEQGEQLLTELQGKTTP